MSATISPTTTGTGRKWLWLGIACTVLGPVLYAVQLTSVGRTETPWYAPALATVGVILVWLALRRRTTIARGVALVLVAALAGLQWWFLTGYTKLPAYTGPVTAGESFPTFAARRADGSPFTRADLSGEATALVFFRGHW